jgi:hypothetical protein
MGERPPKGFRGVAGMQVYWGRPATTYGPIWSKDIERFLTPVNARYGLGNQEGEVRVSGAYCVDAIAEARKRGADINSWATAKILQTVAGPLAESIVRRMSFDEVIGGEPEMESDLNDLRKYRDLGGYSDHAIGKIIGDAETKLTELWMADDRRLWRALLKLAATLPAKGIIDGSRCWEVVSDVFSEPYQAQPVLTTNVPSGR